MDSHNGHNGTSSGRNGRRWQRGSGTDLRQIDRAIHWADRVTGPLGFRHLTPPAAPSRYTHYTERLLLRLGTPVLSAPTEHGTFRYL